MIGFLLKKTFYDLWDNAFKIIVLNLGFLACTAIPILFTSLTAQLADSAILNLVIIALGIFVCSVYLSAAAFSIKTISDYGNFTFGSFFASFKQAWPAGLVMGGFTFLLFLIFTLILPFYLTMEPFAAGIVVSAIIFWSSIFAILSFQYFFTVYIRLSTNIIKTFKKCILISLDNTGFSIFLVFNNIFALLISVIIALMFPGPVGVLLYLDEALRLRLLKYDWLEANPGADRRKIPWDALLIEEREKTGTRSFRNFLFPWKY
jgi:hypothetical protein